jgi:hypothetical protein
MSNLFHFQTVTFLTQNLNTENYNEKWKLTSLVVIEEEGNAEAADGSDD